MSDDSKVAQFSSITGVNADRARFFLESAEWDLDAAVASYFDNNDDDGNMQTINDDEAVNFSRPEPQPASSLKPSSHVDSAKNTNQSSGSKAKAPTTASRPKFGTLASLNKDDHSDSENSDEEPGQAFYAGGSEHSGQQIVGPPKKKTDKVEDLFKAAREHGAEVVEPEDGRSFSNVQAFGGAGYRLGDTQEESSMVGGSRNTSSAATNKAGSVDIVLKLWKNGFSLDDGPLRDISDPANREFLDSIKRGEIPRELSRMAKGDRVSLNMEDRRDQEFVQPKKQVKVFSGEGHRLGSPATAVLANAPPSGGQSNPPAPSLPSASSNPLHSSIKVDNALPTTQLQVRLADGGRLVATFNRSHRVADVRHFIVENRPDCAGVDFALMTTFPNKVLENEQLTLEEASLLGAVIVQKVNK